MLNIKKELNGRDPKLTAVPLSLIYELPCFGCHFNFSRVDFSSTEDIQGTSIIHCFEVSTEGTKLTYDRLIKCMLNGYFRKDNQYTLNQHFNKNLRGT